MVEQLELFPEFTLDKSKPLAQEYRHGDYPDEIVTVPDASPSLYQMVTTGMAGSVSSRYEYGEHNDDDHDLPDIEKLANGDKTVRDEFFDMMNSDEKQEEKQDETKEKRDGKDEKKDESPKDDITE